MASRLLATTNEQRGTLAALLDNISYEIMPFKTAKDKVVAEVPTSIPLTVTATGGKGLEPTLETAVYLRSRGYSVAPHLPARLVRDAEELDTVVRRLEAADIDRVFIIGGDAEEPAGDFADAYGLLTALKERGHHFTDVGIGGYPEGHALISDDAINRSLSDKAPLATRLLTQICFDPRTFMDWGSRVRQQGIDLPIYAGMPGPVSRQKLLRVSAGLGLGQSANFLKKQQNMFWRFFSPSGYEPTQLIKGLVQGLPASDAAIKGFHIFTFNDLAQTENWRRGLLEQTRG
ncbi:methylenetetrahydrofolate reductase [Arthrobacter gengyunqii]|uniref:Methylenetetrahydrofolate reductase n=1 Tax=Arthrobacter gengyunqii TaxID=2886940 RepID=A0A9X1M414_9MICC|nr:methylenetetrahydrofolate reductase [Arthrobacter gengyunqii]MCC3270187.1 methylenetetrahydrofolate reductase [Arthrobacter gengyunqii]UOY96892.1 methylenetetrahydrofolate reductase [Arthrobacter gengyunqii]